MTTSEILDVEKNKLENIIVLHREGVFFVAYEHSAWLFCRCIRKYDVRGGYVKCVRQHVLKIGFPQKSMEKLTAGYKVEDCGNEVHVTVGEMPSGGSFEEWRKGIVSGLENSDRPDKSGKPEKCTDGELSNVLDSISMFPIESRTPMDCMLFLMEIKNRLSGIIY